MDEILIVLVVYKCKFEESSTFKSICAYNQLHGIHSRWLIFDNSSVDVQNDYLEPDKWTKVILQSTGRNEGLPVHYNTAFTFAEKEGIEYLLLLDQDSIFTEGLAPYYQALSEQKEAIIVPRLITGNRMLSPSKYLLGRGFLSDNIIPGRYSLKNYSPLNSGSLIQTPIWRKAGGFNPDIKLDFSDYSFYTRVWKIGVDQFFVMDYDVTHELSSFEEDSLKIMNRFSIYMDDMISFSKELKGINRLLLFFWAGVHFMKVLIRTRFNKNVMSVYFSKLVK